MYTFSRVLTAGSQNVRNRQTVTETERERERERAVSVSENVKESVLSL